MTDTTTPEQSPWEKKLAQEKRRQERRDRNERLFTAVMEALAPKYPALSLDARLDAVRTAIASGGDVNARATLVSHLKERPLGMVAHRITSDAAVPVMQILMEQGADPMLLDKDGNTFTHTLVAQSWRHRDHPSLQDHVRAWFDRVGKDHLTVTNNAQEVPLGLALLALERWSPRSTNQPHPTLVRAMVDAGARVEDLPSRTLFALMEQNQGCHLIGRLFYGTTFSPTEVSWNKRSSLAWQHLRVHASAETITTLLREHGAQLPSEVVPDGMPFLFGLIPSYHRRSSEDRQRRALWNHLVADESAGWADRFALSTLKWLGGGIGHTGLSHERSMASIEWCISQGVDENTWARAARAASSTSIHPLTIHIEKLALQAAMRTLPEEATPAPSTRARPRL